MTEEKKTLIEVIDQVRDRFVSVKPQHMNYEAEKGFAIQLLNNNTYLMETAKKCPSSLLQAINNVASIGLSLNPAEKEAYLIPRSIKIGDKYETRIFLDPSYMGLCKLATDTGSINWIQANCVYSNDEFIDNGFGRMPEHKYKPFDKLEKRGDFVGVFCVAKTAKGDFLTTIMTAEEINGIKGRSELGKLNKGPWVTDFNEQAKKTVVRRGWKMWPKSNLHRLALAVELSNENEGFEPMVTSPKTAQFNSDQKNYFDQLIESNNSLGMYILKSSLCGFDSTSEGAAVWTSLYHSFQKGEKGKYQKLIGTMCESGESQFAAILDAILQANSEGDKFAAIEVLQDLPQECVKALKDRTTAEISAFIDDCLREKAA